MKFHGSCQPGTGNRRYTLLGLSVEIHSTSQHGTSNRCEFLLGLSLKIHSSCQHETEGPSKRAIMTDSRVLAKKRIWRLLHSASMETLLACEDVLRDRQSHMRDEMVTNPSGSVEPSLVCSLCSAPRPPHADAAPWPTRSNGATQGTICRPCLWARRDPSRERQLWPGFRPKPEEKKREEEDKERSPSPKRSR